MSEPGAGVGSRLRAALTRALHRLASRVGLRRARPGDPVDRAPPQEALEATRPLASAGSVFVYRTLRVEVRLREAWMPLGLAIALRIMARQQAAPAAVTIRIPPAPRKREPVLGTAASGEALGS